MSDIAIICDGLSKQYRIGEREKYKALRDVITNAVATPFRKFGSASRNGNGTTAAYGRPPSVVGPSPETRNADRFWALQDVSFQVKRAEVIGIIGRNGAGKSTLLKILSRITKPTKGHATIRGRVGSLLEVGTGFHPELTGRENIYLNAAILGMRKAEVENKFDEIVAFAEVEKFIDTPVKRYSSGMYVRLAFAVAAHMETEVLLVDEVLAVGDAAFQKKCLGKMKDIGREGRTIFFVSHNMSAIQTLCSRSVLLEGGRITLDGDSTAVLKTYLSGSAQVDSFSRKEQPDGRPTIVAGEIRVETYGPDPHVQIDTLISTGNDIKLSLDMQLTDGTGMPVGFGSLGTLNIDRQVKLKSGCNRVSFVMPVDKLALGVYWVSLDLTQPEIEFYDRAANCLCFELVRTPLKNDTRVLPQSWNYGSFELTLIPR